MIGYRRLKNNFSELPEVIVAKCRCGAYTEFDDALRHQYCSNKGCKYTIASKIIEVIKYFDNNVEVDNDIENEVINFVESNSVSSPLEILYTGKYKGQLEEVVNKLRDREYKAWEIIAAGIGNGVKYVAEKWFDGYDSIDEIINCVKNEQVHEIMEDMGVDDLDDSAIAFNIAREILEKEEELHECWESIFKVTDNREKINVFFDGFPFSKINRAEAIWELRNRYKNIRFVFKSSITDSIDIVIKDNEYKSDTDKEVSFINEEQIVKKVNSGEIKYIDIGKEVDGHIKRVGEVMRILKWAEFKDLLNKGYKM